MSDLLPLRGSPKQVVWADKIRHSALYSQRFSPESIEIILKVEDAAWFIGNRSSGDTLSLLFKDPAPHQLAGGSPPPLKFFEPVEAPVGETELPAVHPGSMREVRRYQLRRYQTDLPLQAGADGDENDELQHTDTEPAPPHDAELFAASVCRHPALAEIAVLATLARLYKGDIASRLKMRAVEKLGTVRETLVAEIDKDIDGLTRILK